MEQVVMGQCQSGLAVETCCIEPTACLERFGEPPHHGYTGLFVGGNGLRQPVQGVVSENGKDRTLRPRERP